MHQCANYHIWSASSKCIVCNVSSICKWTLPDTPSRFVLAWDKHEPCWTCPTNLQTRKSSLMLAFVVHRTKTFLPARPKNTFSWQQLPLNKFCYGWLHRRLLRRYRPQSAVNCSTLWERAAGSPPNTSQVSLYKSSILLFHPELVFANHACSWIKIHSCTSPKNRMHNPIWIYSQPWLPNLNP